MKMFRIHTEHTEQYQQIAERIVGAFFSSFNIVRGTGYWNATREDSMTIEVIADDDLESDVRTAAYAIKQANNQEAVYLTITNLETAELL